MWLSQPDEDQGKVIHRQPPVLDIRPSAMRASGVRLPRSRRDQDKLDHRLRSVLDIQWLSYQAVMVTEAVAAIVDDRVPAHYDWALSLACSMSRSVSDVLSSNSWLGLLVDRGKVKETPHGCS